MRIRFYILFLISFGFVINANAQKLSAANSTPPAVQLLDAFGSAARQYNVPEELLKAVAYEETRFQNIVEDPANREPGDQPPVYGIMGLRNDSWFGHSLLEGAKLIGADPDQVALNATLNIKAAAALLNSIADSLKIDRSNLNNWRPVLEEYSGIPQPEIRPFMTFDVFKVLHDGTDLKEIKITQHAEINMMQFSAFVNPQNKEKNVKSTQSIESEDYPPAVWDPSPNYYSTGSFQQLFLVVHDTEGPFAGSLSWLKNPAAKASSHYIIRSSDGYIVQMVREKYAAWHVACWNRVMLGVEHEGYVSNPSYFTEAMYESSAALFRHFVQKYNVPVDRNRIIGHYQHTFPSWVNWVNNTWNPAHPTASFDPTCNTHTDPGAGWNWDHFFNLIQQGATHPSVTGYAPTNPSDSVWATGSIKFSFSQAMAQQAAESAFSISPSVDGNFTWEDNGKTMIFTPSTAFSYTTKYTASIDTNALSILNSSLDSAYTFSFNSKANIPLEISSSYPAQGEAEISPSVQVIVYFNIPLLTSSLGGQISFQDSTGKTVAIKNATYKEYNGQGVLSFMPTNDLDFNAKYTLLLRTGLKSLNASSFENDMKLTFTTKTADDFTPGKIVDDFESMGNWKEPSYSGSTVGVDTSVTKFDIIYGTKVDGLHSGRITYKFTDPGSGLCREYDADKPDLGSDRSNSFGMWVFGDASSNFLEYWFYINSDQNVEVRADTLNWTGWKFVQVPMSGIGTTGDIIFHSVVIAHNPGAADSGAVYIDGAQNSDPNVTGINEGNQYADVPSAYRLGQNYPNPFNPSTTIEYNIPSQGFVSLKVYDMLGREVATLVNGVRSAGTHYVMFNTNDVNGSLTSGIYFYTIKAGDFMQTKKFVLMK